MRLSVIITTYNSEEWLRKVLIGYSVQTEDDFEILIADDGSDDRTKAVIDLFKGQFKFPIQHVWQQDKGFQKCKILNKAILQAKADYLLFTDGDCIPRKDFVATHLRVQQKGTFLSGGYFKLPMTTSLSINEEQIRNQDCFKIDWLIQNGVRKSFKLSKLSQNKLFSALMNWITPTKSTFNGHNTSCFKSDLLAINGFNETMRYGGLDREIGERLFNYGIVAKQIRYNAICLHLDHERAYYDEVEWNKNLALRAYNKKNNITWVTSGIIKGVNPKKE